MELVPEGGPMELGPRAEGTSGVVFDAASVPLPDVEVTLSGAQARRTVATDAEAGSASRRSTTRSAFLSAPRPPVVRQTR